MYLCISQPPLPTWKIVPSNVLDVADKTINGKNINDENNVFKNNTGITALLSSDFF